MDRNRDYDTNNSYGYGGFGGYGTGSGQDQFQSSDWNTTQRRRGQRSFGGSNQWNAGTDQTSGWGQGTNTRSGRHQGMTPYGVSDQGFGDFGNERYGQTYDQTYGQTYGQGNQSQGWNRRQGGSGYGYRGGNYGQNQTYGQTGQYGYGGYGSGYGQGQTFGQTGQNWSQDWDQGWNQGQGNRTGTGMSGQGYGGGSYGRTVVSPSGTGTWGSQTWQGPHTGKGPARSDDRVADEIRQRLTHHPHLDASNVDVAVQGGEVTLTGSVDSRQSKRMAEQVADSVMGVRDVHNNLTIDQSLLDKIENAFS
jgi:osmotically-inducible protein OsmY